MTQLRTLLLICGICLASIGVPHPSGFHQQAAADEPTNSLLYVPVVTSAYCGAFYDTFEDPAVGWFSGTVGGVRAEVMAGEYRLTFAESGLVWVVAGPMCGQRAYRAAVDARWAGTPGNFIGLLFEFEENPARAYLFAVNTDDRLWLVFEVRDNALNVLIPPTGNNAVLPGEAFNRLAVERVSDDITLSVNGVAVGQLTGAGPAALPVLAGVAAASYTTQQTAEARFDNFLFEPIRE